jgi:WXG100 family type VII secretion target
MAVDGIQISFAEVSATAGTIRSLNNSLSSELDTIRKEINDLSATWISDSSETIRGKINGMVPKFENYKQIVDSYAKFLDNVVTNYNQTEASINNNASAFR